jgi:ATP/maltotriose-dependent transcriptional regulator MalT
MNVFALKCKDISLQVAADTFLGLRFQIDGEFTSSAFHLEKAINCYDEQKHANHCHLFGFDTRVWAYSTLAWVRWISGYERSALDAMESGMYWARRLNHVPTTAIALLYRARVLQALGDVGGVLEAAGELVKVSEKFGLPAYSAYGTIVLSWATGNIEQADAITGVLWNMGCKLCVPLYKSLAAENEMKKGLVKEALSRLDECIRLSEEIDEPHYVPNLYLQKGLYLRSALSSQRQSAMQALTTAAELARKSDMFRIEWMALTALQNDQDSLERMQRLEQISIERPELVSGLIGNKG